MRFSIFGFLLLAVITAPVEAKDTYRIDASASDHQSMKWLEGSATVEDVMDGSKVVFSNRRIDLPGGASSFVIVLFNLSDQAIHFGPENVFIELDKVRVAIIDPVSLDTKLRRDIKRRKALAILGGAFSAQGANGSTSGTYSYSGTSSDGTHVMGSGTYTGHDPALAQQEQRAAQEQSAAIGQAIEARKDAGQRALDWLLRKTTVEPGRAHGGWLAFEIPNALKKKLAKPTPVSILVAVGSEEHRFEGTLSEVD